MVMLKSDMATLFQSGNLGLNSISLLWRTPMLTVTMAYLAL
uniref:Uncharacterized protein n=1 Tax=Rhizophora mucronata TaxID=61149 RepID=A0A2P2QGN9_RHIMU